MGNGPGRFRSCLCGDNLEKRHLQDISMLTMELQDEGLGHSFCYVRPEPSRLSSSKVHHSEDSDATAKATAAPPTTFISISGASVSANTATALSTSIIPDSYSPPCSAFDCSTSFSSVPLQPVPRGQFYQSGPLSGPIDRGFMSGPIERNFMSGPLDKYSSRLSTRRSSLIHSLRSAIARTIARGQNSMVAPVKASSSVQEPEGGDSGGASSSQSVEDSGEEKMESRSLQWAQGKAGEDRVHVVISEEHGWVFVGIYDGFNGPDAPDFLLSNLYSAVHSEVKGLLWKESDGDEPNSDYLMEKERRPNKRSKKWEETQRKWKNEWDKERSERTTVAHTEVLKALSSALKKTEESYLGIADNMVAENPELALMGSCVLVMLMKGDDVYLMNVGDSRAVLAQKASPDMKDESDGDFDGDEADGPPSLVALQLTLDHSTSVEEEVERIRSEHPDDATAVTKDRVKGSLKVTRAFGAGFLKQPKWNDALLEVFRIDYVGSSAYISCNPSLYHHKLAPRDRFLILSSDGLYQYLTNEEAVAEVELFIASFPEGDPAQHLVEEVLFRAARKAGMDFHQLLEIPQGDRRKYHDDVSVIVISLEGRIWRYSV